jgi:hypothetical protein
MHIDSKTKLLCVRRPIFDMRTTPDRTGEQLCWSAPSARAAALDGGSMVSYTDRTRKVVRIAASIPKLQCLF